MSTETADRHQWTTDGELPAIVINYPTCEHCGDDLFIDPDTVSCEACLVTWDRVDEDAKPHPTDDEGEVCAEPYAGRSLLPEEYEHKGRMYRTGPRQPCILPAGHTSGHRHPRDVTTWPTAHDPASGPEPATGAPGTAGVDAGTGEAGSDGAP